MKVSRFLMYSLGCKQFDNYAKDDGRLFVGCFEPENKASWQLKTDISPHVLKKADSSEQ